MRLLLAKGAICLALILGCASFAAADALPVGALSFDQLVSGDSGALFGLDVFNATQSGGGSPVTTFLAYSNLSLTVVLSGGVTENVSLTPSDSSGDFTTGALFSANEVLSAGLTGNFSPTTVSLEDGSVVTIQSDFLTTLSDPAGPIQSGDNALINANPAVQPVPEPGTSVLLVAFLIVVKGYWSVRGARLSRSTS